MISISATLQNFGIIHLLKSLFEGASCSYEYSKKGIIRYIKNPQCEECGTIMNQNGYNIVTKRNIGSVKVGKYICPSCKATHHTDIRFWNEQKGMVRDLLGELLMCLKNGGNSYRRMAEIMNYFVPFEKSSLYSQFYQIVEKSEFIPSNIKGKIAIINFDEEYLKISGKWRYRLTLLNYETKLPIAEKVVKKLTDEVIIEFIKSNFNPEQYDKIYVVTDLKPSYSNIFKSLFGKKLVHQYCLFHLYQLICKEFSKNSSISELLLQYRLMNIFYNYDSEIEQIKKIAEEENSLVPIDKKELKSWTKEKKEEIFAHFFEHRNEDSNKLREPVEAYLNMLELYEDYDKMPSNIQKRLEMIDNSILNFLAYRSIPNAPATNNAIEGYFSVTTDPILKKQMKTIKGADIAIKSYSFERTKRFIAKIETKKFKPSTTLIELILPLRLLGNPL